MNGLKDFSIYVSSWGVEPPSITDFVDLTRHAEEIGYYSFSLAHVPLLPWPEHTPGMIFSQFPRKYRDHQLDCVAVVPMLLQATSTIKVGFNVLIAGWVHPFVWAKYLASLDVASNGRLIAGFGLGYAPPGEVTTALHNFGLNSRKRGAMSDEALELITRLWTEPDPISYEETFSKGIDLIVEPKPIQKPYPELWWAGDAEASVPRAAKFAHVLELTWPTPAMAKIRADALRALVAAGPLAHPRKVETAVIAFAEVKGADYTHDQLREVFHYPVHNDDLMAGVIAGSPDRCAEVVHEFTQAGVSHLVLDLNRHGLDPLKLVHEQMEEFAAKVVPIVERSAPRRETAEKL